MSDLQMTVPLESRPQLEGKAMLESASYSLKVGEPVYNHNAWLVH